MPSLETWPDFDDANGLVALMTCGSFETFVVAWLIAPWSAVTVPCLAWKTIWPPYPPSFGNEAFSVSRPLAESVPETV